MKKELTYFDRDSETKFFWEPCLDDIEKIERLYYRLEQRSAVYEKKHQDISIIIKPLIGNAKEFILYALVNSHENLWRAYHLSLYEGRLTWSTGYSSEPTENQHKELGQQWHDLYQYRLRTLLYRTGRIERMLIQAIRRHILQDKITMSNIFHYIINGRDYWLRYKEITGDGRKGLQFIPEVKIVKAVIGKADWAQKLVGKVLSIEEMQKIYKEKEEA